MSRAFVKEMEDAAEELPDRPVSPHPNYVTANGLAAIEAEGARLHAELAEVGDDRAQRLHLERDLRYWQARRTSAEVIPPPEDNETVRFGATVTISRDDGREQTWTIVGEDEADPTRGTLPYVAPLAHALIGKSVGDTVQVAGGEAEILKIA